jgi:hypothetical protein
VACLTKVVSIGRLSLVACESLQYNDFCEGESGIALEELKRDNVGQLVSLELLPMHDNDTRVHRIVVFNTHLFWNHRYDYVRFRQTLFALQHLTAFEQQSSNLQLHASSHTSGATHVESHVIMAGDYNACPDTNIYRLLLTQHEREHLDSSELLPPQDHYDPFSSWLIQPTEQEKEAYLKERNLDTDFAQISEQQKQQRLEQVEHYLAQWRQQPILQSCYERVDYQTLAPSAPDIHERYAPVADSIRLWKREPLFTNFRAAWCGTLDFIMLPILDQQNNPMPEQGCVQVALQRRTTATATATATATDDTTCSTTACERTALIVRQVLRIPDVDELVADKTLPSDQHGSDHVPIACRFDLVSFTTITPPQ